jgi:hypothetical protein
MPFAHIVAFHGGATGAVDMLVGLGPVILGAVLIGAFVVLITFDRSAAARSGYRDERPTGARLLFSGAYYQLEELLRQQSVENRQPPEPAESAARAARASRPELDEDKVTR